MTSKTKKRLSDDPWSLRIICLLLVGALAAKSFAAFTLFTGPDHAVIFGQIPVIDKPTPHYFGDPAQMTTHMIEANSPMIVLTSETFYFGEVRAFTEEFSNVRNKFFLAHQDGAPQVGSLLETMRLWRKHPSEERTREGEPVVFLPTAEIPLPIVIQIMDGLQKSDLFSHVVLATGLL